MEGTKPIQKRNRSVQTFIDITPDQYRIIDPFISVYGKIKIVRRIEKTIATLVVAAGYMIIMGLDVAPAWLVGSFAGIALVLVWTVINLSNNLIRFRIEEYLDRKMRADVERMTQITMPSVPSLFSGKVGMKVTDYHVHPDGVTTEWTIERDNQTITVKKAPVVMF